MAPRNPFAERRETALTAASKLNGKRSRRQSISISRKQRDRSHKQSPATEMVEANKQIGFTIDMVVSNVAGVKVKANTVRILQTDQLSTVKRPRGRPRKVSSCLPNEPMAVLM